MIQNIDETIRNEMEQFVSNLERRSRSEKRLCHYRSALNMANGLLSFCAKSSEPFKILMIEYFQTVRDLNYSIDRYNSIILYGQYIRPVGRYLIKRREFKTKGDIITYIVIGLIIDSLVYFFIGKYYFVFTPLLIFIGIIWLKYKIKKREFFNIRW